MTTKDENDDRSPAEKHRAKQEARFGALYAIELEETRKRPGGALSSNDPEVLREFALRLIVEHRVPAGLIVGPDGDDAPHLWDALTQLHSMLAPIADAMCANNPEKIFTAAAATGIFYTLNHVTESVRRLADWDSYCRAKTNEIASQEHPVGPELAAVRKERDRLEVQAIDEGIALFNVLRERSADERQLYTAIVSGLRDPAVRDRVRVALNGGAQ